MRGAELVTVVVPCFKQEAYLAEAIESVLAQTYRPFEIVVVDDGSDNVEGVTAAYPDVRVVRQDNRGLGAARATGSRVANGQFVVFLDADDRLLPNAVHINAAHLRLDPLLGLVAGLTTLITDDGRPLPTLHRPRPATDHYLNLLKCNITTGIHAVMFRRAAIEDVGGFDTTRRLAGVEDYDLYLRIARRHRILYHGNILGEYRQHDASMSRNYALMMRSATRLLREHAAAGTTGDVADAARTGIAVFKDYYTDLMIKRVRHSFRNRDVRALSTDVKDMVALHPVGLAKLVSKRLYRRLAQIPGHVVEISGTDSDGLHQGPL